MRFKKVASATYKVQFLLILDLYRSSEVVILARFLQVMNRERALLLDIYRIFLCVGVVVYHYFWPRPACGPFMVNGFLVMSGFLVGMMFKERSEFDSTRFYASKVRRLLPLFLLAIVVGLLHRMYEGCLLPEWGAGQWAHLSISELLLHWNTPLWYMAVECALLFMVPFFYYLHRFRFGMAGGCIVALVTTWGLFSCVPDCAPFGEGLYYSPLARCWQFMAGILASGLCVFLCQRRVEKSCLFKGATLLLFAVFVAVAVVLMSVLQKEELNYYNYTFSFDLLTTAFYCLLIPCLFAFGGVVNNAFSAFVNKAALLTYPVFLFHVPVYHFTCDAIETYYGYPEKWVFRSVAALVTLALSLLLLRLEKRCLG